MFVKLDKKTYQTQIPVAIGTRCVINIYRIKTRSNKPAFIEVTNSCNGFHPEIMKVVQLLKKFLVVYAVQKFIAVFAGRHH